MSETQLPYSFCKRFGVIAALSPVSGKLKLTLKNGAPADAVSEAQRLLGMIDEIEVESDLEFNRLLSQHFEKQSRDFVQRGRENRWGTQSRRGRTRVRPNPRICSKATTTHPLFA